jgi:D-aminopeptidase
VVVTDAPVDAAGCVRLARRVGLGLARTGSTAHHGSGEIFLAAATGLREEHAAAGTPRSATASSAPDFDPLFEAVVDASEEAVINSLLGAETTIGRDGNTSYALPADDVFRLLSAHGHRT